MKDGGRGKLTGPGFMRVVVWSFESLPLGGFALFQEADGERNWIKVGPLKRIDEWSDGGMVLIDDQDRTFYVEVI